MADLDVKDGDVVRYHPITTRPEFVLVRITGAPYAVGSGEMVARAVNDETGKVHYPWLAALTKNEGKARAPQKPKRQRRSPLAPASREGGTDG